MSTLKFSHELTEADLDRDDVKADGYFTIEVIRDGKSGPEVLERRYVKNLVVNTGKKQTWRMSSGLSTKVWKFMRIGTSPAAAGSGDTNVKSPVTGTLKTVNSQTMSGRTYQVVYSYPSGAGTKSATGISEVCILNQHTSPGGSALNRSTFTAVNKTTADKLKITYSVRIS